MDTPKNLIGSGLDAIFSAKEETADKASAYGGKIELISIENILASPYQARKNFSEAELRELSLSIKQHGILQPLVVRKSESGKYELIAGERRLRASMLAGLEVVPVIECQVDNTTAMVFGLIENIQRQALNPIEEANGLKRLIDEFRLTHQEISEKIGRPRSTVTNTIRLLNLSLLGKDLLSKGEIDVGHAKLLLPLEIKEQDFYIQRIISDKLTVRETDNFISNRYKSPKAATEKTNDCCFSNDWEIRLKQALGLNVSVKVNENGKGKVIIRTGSTKELLKFLVLLEKPQENVD